MGYGWFACKDWSPELGAKGYVPWWPTLAILAAVAGIVAGAAWVL